MVDISAIAGGMNSLRVANDIVRAMLTIRDGKLLQAKTIELQGAILAAQQTLFEVQQERSELVEKIGGLESEISALKDWRREADRYRLVEIGAGVFAYCLRPEHRNAEPSHLLCANCFGRQRKAILQNDSPYPSGLSVLKCNNCKAEIKVKGRDQEIPVLTITPPAPHRLALPEVLPALGAGVKEVEIRPATAPV